MAFWKKGNERRKRELEGIKNRVEGKQPLPNMPLPPSVEGLKEEAKEPTLPELAPPKMASPESIPKITPSMKELSQEPGAPLFIKIEKYEDVIQRLEDLKNELKTLTRLLSLHSEIEELKTDIFSRIKDSVSSLTNVLISMDEIFVKPERPDITEAGVNKEEHGVEEQILDLGEELRHLKRELTKIE